MLAYMAVGYSIGFSQNYNEIQNNKDKITWLQQKTFDQQKEIDAFKAYVVKTKNLEYQMNDLIKRITSLEALIKSRRQ
jgi:peptidoglycan hydrolase CwlO-like protein